MFGRCSLLQADETTAYAGAALPVRVRDGLRFRIVTCIHGGHAMAACIPPTEQGRRGQARQQTHEAFRTRPAERACVQM